MDTKVNSRLFPLIRYLSKVATPVLMRLPVTANQITATSLVSGLAAAVCLIQGARGWDIAAGVLFVITYVLDNCDGEIARLKDQCSEFGMRFDTFVDWAVHTAFFAALGIGVAGRFDNDLWLWMGMIAAAGGTINYGVGFYLDARKKAETAAEAIREGGGEGENPEETHREPEGLSDWALYIFRELTRADFCFIVLALALFDVTWVLLPAGAIRSQVYWITQFAQGAKDFHV